VEAACRALAIAREKVQHLVLIKVIMRA